MISSIILSMQKWNNNLLVIFLYYFVFWIGFTALRERSNFVWKETLLESFLLALFLTISFKYINLERNPIYLKLSDYESVMVELENIGANPVKIKGEKTIYKIRGAGWLSNTIIVKKTAFYLCVEAPEKYKERFLTYSHTTES